MVDFLWDASAAFAVGSAILLGLFSISVGFLGRFQGASKWYAVFGGGFAATTALGGIAGTIGAWADQNFESPAQYPNDASLTYSLIMTFAALAAIVWTLGVVRLLQHYGARHAWKLAGLGSTIAVATLVPTIFKVVAEPWFVETSWAFKLSFWIASIENILFFVAMGTMASAGWLMAQARLRSPVAGQAILAAALMAYPLTWPAFSAARSASPGNPLVWVGIISIVGFLVMVVGWLRVRAQHRDMVPWAVIGTGAVFFAGSFFYGIFTVDAPTPVALARTFDVVLVAYAILRLQYLGLDVKVRWGLSKSTVAAVFIAVFFIASEAASQFFGDRFNNNYIGIAAAGVLVLGIAPLQRFADKLATSAVPGPSAVADGPAAIYARQVQQAWQDGRISPSEKLMLRALRQDLGISVEAADSLENQVESGLAAKLD